MSANDKAERKIRRRAWKQGKDYKDKANGQRAIGKRFTNDEEMNQYIQELFEDSIQRSAKHYHMEPIQIPCPCLQCNAPMFD